MPTIATLDVPSFCLGGNVFGWTADEEASFAVLDRALQASLDRLGIEHVDLYYAHTFDDETPLADTVAAFGGLVDDGLVRHVAASNHDAAQLVEGLRLADEQGVPGWVAVQNGMSLVRHEAHDPDIAAVCRDNGVAAVPYGALGGGFLTGKYTPGGPTPDTPRAERTRRHLDADRGPAVLAALDEVAAGHGVPVAAVAVAWVAHQDAVVAPIASARSPEQLEPLLAGATLDLTSDELAALTTASRLPGAPTEPPCPCRVDGPTPASSRIPHVMTCGIRNDRCCGTPATRLWVIPAVCRARAGRVGRRPDRCRGRPTS